MSEKSSKPEPESEIKGSGSTDVVDGVVIAESVGSIFSEAEASQVIDTVSCVVSDDREGDSMQVEGSSETANRTVALEVAENSKLARVLDWLDDDKLAAAIAEKALVELLAPLAFASKADPDADPVLGELEVAGAASLAYLSEAVDTIEAALGLSVAGDFQEKAAALQRAVRKGEHRYSRERVSKLYKDVRIKDKRRKAKLILNNLETASERAGTDVQLEAAIKTINEACVFESE